MRHSIQVLAFALLLAAAGCASTQKRYDKAVALEAQGRYADAADYYIKVLEKEPDWEDARARLADVGAQAVDAYWSAARARDDTGDAAGGIAALRRLQRLHDRAGAVGVALALPPGYGAYRDELTDEAVAALVREAERAAQQGHWNEALAAYEKAQRDFSLDPEVHRRLDVERARALLAWGRSEFDREYYRAAFDRAALIEPIMGAEAPETIAARRLQEEALAAGERYVALLPFGASDAVLRGGREALRDLNDVLLYEHYVEPPLFIVQADPVQARRELRRRGHRHEPLTRTEAAEIGRVLDADLVVSGELIAFEAEERDVKTDTRSARTRGRNAQDTTYTVERYRLRLEGEVRYRLVDPVTRRVLEEGDVSADASDRFERAFYDGNPDHLDLSSAERDLFDRDALRDAERVLQDELIDELAARLADRLYDRLLRRID